MLPSHSRQCDGTSNAVVVRAQRSGATCSSGGGPFEPHGKTHQGIFLTISNPHNNVLSRQCCHYCTSPPPSAVLVVWSAHPSAPPLRVGKTNAGAQQGTQDDPRRGRKLDLLEASLAVGQDRASAVYPVPPPAGDLRGSGAGEQQQPKRGGSLSIPDMVEHEAEASEFVRRQESLSWSGLVEADVAARVDSGTGRPSPYRSGVRIRSCRDAADESTATRSLRPGRTAKRCQPLATPVGMELECATIRCNIKD